LRCFRCKRRGRHAWLGLLLFKCPELHACNKVVADLTAPVAHAERCEEGGYRLCSCWILSSGVQALLKATVKADLRPFWTWNTKQMFVYLQAEYITERNQLNQVSLADNIIRSRERVNLNWDVRQEYPLIDQGNSLRGQAINLTLVWDVMPKVGAHIRILHRQAMRH
jgi:Signal peptidase subunit